VKLRKEGAAEQPKESGSSHLKVILLHGSLGARDESTAEHTHDDSEAR